MSKEDIVKYQFTSEQSRTQAAENGRKGGIASGEARREKKAMRAIAEEIINGTFTDDKGVKRTGQEIIKRGLLNNLSKSGSKNWGKAMELLIKLTDADQPAKVEVTFDNSFIDALNNKAKEAWDEE